MLLLYSLCSAVATVVACVTARRATSSLDGFLLYLFSAPLHALVVLNACGCLLFLFAKSVQLLFLGPLRETEVKVRAVAHMLVRAREATHRSPTPCLRRRAEDTGTFAQLYRVQDHVRGRHAGASHGPAAVVGRVVQRHGVFQVVLSAVPRSL